MQEIHFDEEQLKDLQSLGAALFLEDSEDPRSWNYRRQLIRPVIPWTRILLFLLLFTSGVVGTCYLLIAVQVPTKIALIACTAGALVVLLLFMKGILICLVKIYQRFAPDSIRNKCRFEPSCSQYMILSLQKYGLWKGLMKGIDRLRRCNANDGGFDEP